MLFLRTCIFDIRRFRKVNELLMVLGANRCSNIESIKLSGNVVGHMKDEMRMEDATRPDGARQNHFGASKSVHLQRMWRSSQKRVLLNYLEKVFGKKELELEWYDHSMRSKK